MPRLLTQAEKTKIAMLHHADEEGRKQAHIDLTMQLAKTAARTMAWRQMMQTSTGMEKDAWMKEVGQGVMKGVGKLFGRGATKAVAPAATQAVSAATQAVPAAAQAVTKIHPQNLLKSVQSAKTVQAFPSLKPATYNKVVGNVAAAPPATSPTRLNQQSLIDSVKKRKLNPPTSRTAPSPYNQAYGAEPSGVYQQAPAIHMEAGLPPPRVAPTLPAPRPQPAPVSGTINAPGALQPSQPQVISSGGRASASASGQLARPGELTELTGARAMTRGPIKGPRSPEEVLNFRPTAQPTQPGQLAKPLSPSGFTTQEGKMLERGGVLEKAPAQAAITPQQKAMLERGGVPEKALSEYTPLDYSGLDKPFQFRPETGLEKAKHFAENMAGNLRNVAANPGEYARRIGGLARDVGSSAAGQIGQGVRQGAEQLSHGVQLGAQQVAEGVQRGARQVAQGAQQGVQKVRGMLARKPPAVAQGGFVEAPSPSAAIADKSKLFKNMVDESSVAEGASLRGQVGAAQAGPGVATPAAAGAKPITPTQGPVASGEINRAGTLAPAPATATAPASAAAPKLETPQVVGAAPAQKAPVSAPSEVGTTQVGELASPARAGKKLTPAQKEYATMRKDNIMNQRSSNYDKLQSKYESDPTSLTAKEMKSLSRYRTDPKLKQYRDQMANKAESEAVAHTPEQKAALYKADTAKKAKELNALSKKPVEEMSEQEVLRHQELLADKEVARLSKKTGKKGSLGSNLKWGLIGGVGIPAAALAYGATQAAPAVAGALSANAQQPLSYGVGPNPGLTPNYM